MGFQDERKKCIFYSGYICSVIFLILKVQYFGRESFTVAPHTILLLSVQDENQEALEWIKGKVS